MKTFLPWWVELVPGPPRACGPLAPRQSSDLLWSCLLLPPAGAAQTLSSSYDLSTQPKWMVLKCLERKEGRKEGLFSCISSGQWQSCHLVTLQFLWPKCALGSQINNDWWGGECLFSFLSPGAISRRLGTRKLFRHSKWWVTSFQFSPINICVAVVCFPFATRADLCLCLGHVTGVYTYIHTPLHAFPRKAAL